MTSDEYYSLKRSCKARKIYQNRNSKWSFIIVVFELLLALTFVWLAGNILPQAVGLSLALLVILIVFVTTEVQDHNDKKLIKQQLGGIICHEIATINQQQVSYAMVCQNDIMEIYLRFFAVSENLENANDKVYIDLFFTENELKDMFYKQAGHIIIGRIKRVSE
jgi:hypothetical protein